jgi:RNA polymerase sigma-70 factor (ECF subfamily)
MGLFRDPQLAEIEELYRQRFGHFARVAAAITGDRDLALEAVQDAFAGTVRSRRRYRREGPLEALVWRAVVNDAIKAKARASRGQPADDGERRNGHEPLLPSELAPLIRLLPDRQRLALFLRYYADLDYRSIAEALEIEVGTVSATLSAAHTTLRRALAEVPE